MWVHARSKVSCTKSSAWSKFPHNENRDARSFGASARIASCAHEAFGAVAAARPGARASRGDFPEILVRSVPHARASAADRFSPARRGRSARLSGLGLPFLGLPLLPLSSKIFSIAPAARVA